jgi:hypothetical protein
MIVFANVRYALPFYAFLFPFSSAGLVTLLLPRSTRTPEVEARSG